MGSPAAVMAMVVSLSGAGAEDQPMLALEIGAAETEQLAALTVDDIPVHIGGLTAPEIGNPIGGPLSSESAPAALAYDLNWSDQGAGQRLAFSDQNGPANPDIVVEGQPAADAIDSLSMDTFELAQEIDEAFVGPLAKAYGETLPKPIRRGMRNFLRNLGEPVNFLNYMLQLKPGKAIETAARFAINSTLGFGGLVDMAAKPGLKLPYTYNGFANTLGYYGVKPGKYMYLPLVGSTTARDLFGDAVDRFLVPLGYGRPINTPVFGLAAGVTTSLNQRIENDSRIQEIREQSANPYADARNDYLKLREAEIEALKTKKSRHNTSNFNQSVSSTIVPINLADSKETPTYALQIY